MKQVKYFFATTLLAVCFVITNSCSQTAVSGSSSVLGVFEASTPCDDVSKTILEIPSSTKCELTLNRINPITPSSAKLTSQTTSPPRIATDSTTVGIFDGRTPCSSELRELNGISAAGCQIIKCRLTLYQDVKTHTPTTFQLQTIYVGKRDTRYTNTGKWKVTQGTKTDPEAIVYQLELDSDKLQGSLAGNIA